MKISTILASCALALFNTQTCLASPLNDTGISSDNVHLENTPSTSISSPVGESVPFTTCSKTLNDTNSGFIVNEILLSPNPPVRGQDLDITIKGDLRTKMDKGALVRVAVWKFGMAFATLTYDWCANVKGLTCPTEPGNITFSVLQNIERAIPAWTYTLSFDVFNQAEENISCLQLKTKVAKKPKEEPMGTLVDMEEMEDPE